MNHRKMLGFLSIEAFAVVVALGSVSSRAEDAIAGTDATISDMTEYVGHDQPEEGIDINNAEMPEACILETLSDSEFQAMMQEKSVQVYGARATVRPDRYEPNDSPETAFSYNRTTKLTGDPFIAGYTAANCHEEGNEDWFKLSMTWGDKYDVVLKNLYGQDRHIYIWSKNYGHWEQWGAPNPQTAMPEKFVFNCKTGGEYYIQIVGGGPESSGFYFAVEKQGTINTALWPYEITSEGSK